MQIPLQMTFENAEPSEAELHKIEAHGRVSKISADYGFIATSDGCVDLLPSLQRDR